MRAALPQHGTPWPELEREMRQLAAGDIDWRAGKAAVYVFNAGAEVAQVQKEAYALFQSENGLGPLAFPSLKRMESEIVGMALDLLHAPGRLDQVPDRPLAILLFGALTEAALAAARGEAEPDDLFAAFERLIDRFSPADRPPPP